MSLKSLNLIQDQIYINLKLKNLVVIQIIIYTSKTLIQKDTKINISSCKKLKKYYTDHNV